MYNFPAAAPRRPGAVREVSKHETQAGKMALNEGSSPSRSAREEPGSDLLGEIHGTEGQEKVEVWVRRRADRDVEVELIQFMWGSGVGWYVQKSMTLDGPQARALQALLLPLTASAPTRMPTPSPPAQRRSPRPQPRVEQDGNVIRLLFP
jgi:hypothetical protein